MWPAPSQMTARELDEAIKLAQRQRNAQVLTDLLRERESRTSYPPTPMPADVASFPLEPGESILWWREAPDGGHVIRVRTADGVESIHDTYPE